MDKCPKCGFQLSGGEVECPACGIILAKYRPERAASPPPAAAQPSPGTAPQSSPGAAPQPSAGVAPQPSPWPAAQAAPAPPITANTLATLHGVRPWIRFIVGYGFVVSALMVLGGVVALIGGLAEPGLLLAGLIYLVYGGVGFALVLPLRRSIEPLGQVKSLGPSTALEQFAVHHAVFWRRTGVVTAVAVGLVVLAILALLVAVVLGGLAALSE